MKVAHAETMQNIFALSVYNGLKVQVLMPKVQHRNYYQQKLQNFHFQPKVLLLAQPLPSLDENMHGFGPTSPAFAIFRVGSQKNLNNLAQVQFQIMKML